MRQLYFAAMTRLDHQVAEKAILDFAVAVDKHRNLTKEVEGVKLEFVWDPWLNSTSLFNHLARFRERSGSADYEQLVRKEGRESASLIIAGTPGLWAARQGGDGYLDHFREGIDNLMPYLHRDIHNLISLPRTRSPAAFDELSNTVLVAPVIVPAYDRLSSSRARSMTPERIDAMNWNLQHLQPAERSHTAWSYNAMAHGHADAFLEDGIHAVDLVVERKLDIALNAHCNAALVRRGYANQITCCVPYPSLSRVQILILGLSLLALPVLFLDRRQDAFAWARTTLVMDVLLATATVIAVSVYCLLSDRTHLLIKQDKNFDVSDFILPLIGLAFLAAVSVRSRPPQLPSSKGLAAVSFLPREQTDEWKGWMQAFILLYTYNAASESLAMYKVHKFLVATYIFLSCYGHTMYFLRTEDYSLRRVTYVLCRLNLLSCVLGLATSSEWIIYSAPLITFWFGVTYISLACFRRFNNNPLGFFLKIVVLAGCITFLMRRTHLLETVLRVLKSTCSIHWDVNILRAHYNIDRFVAYFGMLTAAAVHRVSVLRRRQHGINARAPFEKTNDALDRALLDVAYPERDAVPVKPIMIFFAVAYLVVFIILAFAAQVYRNNDAYNAFHPYTSPWFVLSAVVARNALQPLRESYVPLAAALGRSSLEAYVLHHHIWLGSDGAGILRVGRLAFLPRKVEIVVLTAVFLWASAQSHTAVQDIACSLTGTVRAEGVDEVTLGRPLKDGKKSPVPWQPTAEEDKPRDEAKPSSSTVSNRALKLRVAGLLTALWLGNEMYGA
ncbi:putative O-acetyltransferase CAS1 [Colletotrichum trifolii]|uniref:Putative O-acetyltransferase CAS1 n=1 Tax=Colletotrichum trifolii TaxID=5466 RepID=A0A4R8R1C0_COLTR|nr:putative O-acetyltransferase CAS1 [Colletotrichum trifolii]